MDKIRTKSRKGLYILDGFTFAAAAGIVAYAIKRITPVDPNVLPGVAIATALLAAYLWDTVRTKGGKTSVSFTFSITLFGFVAFGWWGVIIAALGMINFRAIRERHWLNFSSHKAQYVLFDFAFLATYLLMGGKVGRIDLLPIAVASLASFSTNMLYLLLFVYLKERDGSAVKNVLKLFLNVLKNFPFSVAIGVLLVYIYTEFGLVVFLAANGVLLYIKHYTLSYYKLQESVEENKELREKYYRADRLALAGRVASFFAHEVKSPLSGIGVDLMALERMANGKADPGDLKKRIASIQEQLDRMDKISRDMLKFARYDGEDGFRKIDLIESIREGASFIRHTSPKRVAVELDLPDGEVPVRGNPTLLQSVWANLGSNACEAILGHRDGGRIGISVGIEGESAVIRFKDNGGGIDPKIRTNLFKPFVTTKENGTGLGLNMVQEIVQRHRGEISVETEEGEGTTFTISLPLCR
ncbi:MAG: sensor histidine kinase [bacterium]